MPRNMLDIGFGCELLSEIAYLLFKILYVLWISLQLKNIKIFILSLVLFHFLFAL